MSVLGPVISWLRDIPEENDTARGNGLALQLLFAMMGITLPLIWPYRLAALLNPLTFADWTDLFADSAVVLAAWTGIVAIRRGKVRRATTVFVGLLLASLGATYLARGLIASMLDQTYVVLTVVLGGLILGRHALWRTYGLLLLVFSAGAAVDVGRLAARHAAHPSVGALNVLPLALSYLAITMVLDQCVAALRGSVLDAEERGRRLAETNRVLQEEIVAHQLSREQLVHAQRVEAVGRLAGGVAHDFNNILSVIEGYAEAREDSDDPAVLRSALYGVSAAARRGAAISRKLLSFGRRDVARLEVIDLKRALRDIRHVLRQLFSHATTLIIDVADEARYIRFDPDQLELMVLNIATNARDAMPADGRFEMRVRAVSGDRVRLAFTDNGEGIPESARARVFDPFFTTKPPHAGSGLGLAVVRDLIRAHGGEVSLDSVLGDGTTVTIDLPAAPIPRSLDGTGPSLIHTLLIEDEDVLREMWAKRLEADGFLVVQAGTATQALRLAGELPDALQLVITDLRLGDNDPASWLHEVRSALPDVPVLVVSSHFPQSVQPSAEVAILHKPCAPDLLVAEAARLVDVNRRELRTF
jgi:signal transduction histidine kinase/CheY-like chemotaxis protein